MLKQLLKIIVPVVFMWVSTSHAGVISPESYSSSDENQMYWTNNTLNLDIMRLSYSDLLNTDGTSYGEQASYEDINTYLDSQSEWRWATVDEFAATQNWFDTDPDNRDWTEAQNEGSSLFFALNGTGPLWSYYADEEDVFNYGYDDDGWAYWEIVTDFGVNFAFPEGARRDDTTLRHVSIGDYADTHPLAQINPENLDVNKGWHNLPDDPGQYYTSYQTLSSESYNAAGLLVRDIQVTVPEPSSFLLLLFSLILLISAKQRIHKQ